MSSLSSFKKLALRFEQTDTKPHFDRLAFRVKGKIFATLLQKDKTANLMLSPESQYVFTKASPAVCPVPGGWGKKGATTVDLAKVSDSFLLEMLTCSFCRNAPKKLAEKYLKS
jgi:hypothetical protein